MVRVVFKTSGQCQVGARGFSNVTLGPTCFMEKSYALISPGKPSLRSFNQTDFIPFLFQLTAMLKAYFTGTDI